MTYKVAVVGGGWAGCSAALSAASAGAEVHLFEKTDMLLGTGLVGGIMRNNGRYTAAEEGLMLGGGGELFAITDQVSRHKDIEFPGHEHASLYDITAIEPAVKRKLQDAGVHLHLSTRIVDAVTSRSGIERIYKASGEAFFADAFVDATGTSGPMGNCQRYGNGCVMCIQRCPAFGPRKSLTALVGVAERAAVKRVDVPGAMSGSGKLNTDSLSAEIQQELHQQGVALVPVPEELVRESKLASKACQQYATSEYAHNLILLDTGHAKLMAPYMPLEELRQVPGLEKARFEDPYAGGVGNSIRFTAIAPRDNHLKVDGMNNLFCAGEKSGIYVGHTEAICTGALAGHNAARQVAGLDLLQLPRTTAIGEFIAFGREELKSEEGWTKSYTFAGSVFFERMNKMGLHITDQDKIDERISKIDLANAFSQTL